MLPPNKEWGLELEIRGDEIIVAGVHDSKIAALRGMQKGDIVAFLQGEAVQLGVESLDDIYLQIVNLKKENKTISIQVYRKTQELTSKPLEDMVAPPPKIVSSLKGIEVMH